MNAIHLEPDECNTLGTWLLRWLDTNAPDECGTHYDIAFHPKNRIQIHSCMVRDAWKPWTNRWPGQWQTPAARKKTAIRFWTHTMFAQKGFNQRSCQKPYMIFNISQCDSLVTLSIGPLVSVSFPSASRWFAASTISNGCSPWLVLHEHNMKFWLRYSTLT